MDSKIFLFISFSLLINVFNSGFQASTTEIPLEVFAKPAKFKTMKISPKGEYLAFTFEDDRSTKFGVIDIKTMKPTSGFDFGEDRHVVYFDWVNDERVVMVHQKRRGWLDGTRPRTQIAAANADGGRRHVLWDDQNFAYLRIIDLLEDQPDKILVEKMSWRDRGKVSLFELDVYNAKLSYMGDSPPDAAHTEPGIISYRTDSKGQVRFAVEMDQGENDVLPEDDTFYIHYKELKSNKWQKLKLPNKRKKRPRIDLLGTDASQTKAYFTSNFDLEDKGTDGLFVFDLEKKEIELLFRHEDVDILGGIYGSKNQVIGAYYEPGYPTVHYIDASGNETDINRHKGLSASFKGQYVSVTSITTDKSQHLLSVRSDRNPGDFYLFDSEKMKVKYYGSSKPEVNPKTMAAVEPFILQARDGLKMYGYLTIPNGVEQKNLPMVVYPHGGPYNVMDDWRWDRRAQMLASRGYLVLQLNFRGSGGYGESFLEAGYSHWGTKMQDDLTDATQWAINNGLADPDRICIHGVSYGGYAALNAVVREPDLYQCSIPDAGVYEMQVQWDEADSFKGYKGDERKSWYMKRSIGSEENAKARSPVYFLDKLKADLFIVHGGDDVRVPIINAEILEEKLKEAGKDYIKLYKDNEGHGFTKPENRVELYSKILEFLDQHIGEK